MLSGVGFLVVNVVVVGVRGGFHTYFPLSSIFDLFGQLVG